MLKRIVAAGALAAVALPPLAAEAQQEPGRPYVHGICFECDVARQGLSTRGAGWSTSSVARALVALSCAPGEVSAVTLGHLTTALQSIPWEHPFAGRFGSRHC